MTSHGDPGDDSSMFEHDAMIDDPRVLPSGVPLGAVSAFDDRVVELMGGEPIAVGSHSKGKNSDRSQGFHSGRPNERIVDDVL